MVASADGADRYRWDDADVGLSVRQRENIFTRAGGNPALAAFMGRISKREDPAGNPRINNRGLNKNGSVDWGLWQINDVWRRDPVVGPLFRSGKILTPLGNARAAVRILAVQGPHAWSTFNPSTDASYLSGFGTSGPLGRRAGRFRGPLPAGGGAIPGTGAGGGQRRAGALLQAAGGDSVGQASQSGVTLLEALQGAGRSMALPTAPAQPSFSAHVALPRTYQAPMAGVAASSSPDISALLDAIKTPAPNFQAPGGGQGASATGGGGGGASSPHGPAPAPVASGSGQYPLGKVGKVIGVPFQGTHAKAFNVSGGSDNWQSENAIDISIPIGTPVYAVADGVLGNTGSLGQGGRFAGLRTNLVGADNAWYYAHMSKLAPGIKAGARVRKGQLLGYSGEANGVAHLHFAQQRGDPRRRLGH